MTHLHEASAGTLRRLLELARELLQAPTPQSILEVVGLALQELLAADGALLLLGSGKSEQLTEFDRYGRLRSGRQETALHLHARRALRDRTPVLLPDVPGPPGTSGEAPAVSWSESLLAFPFPPAAPVGVLAAFWHRRTGQHRLPEHITTLRFIGELTAAALGNAAVRHDLEARVVARTEQIETAAREHAEELDRRSAVADELQRIAATDVLTGLLNRRGFFLQAERSLKVARRRREPCALIFADVDGLKSVNDALGHDVGDQLIQDCASVFRKSFRDSDVVARLGGDEFAAFTLDSAQPQAILSRIRDNIDRLHENSPRPYQISFSTGIVSCDPASGIALSDYLLQADQNMYAQKHARHDA